MIDASRFLPQISFSKLVYKRASVESQLDRTTLGRDTNAASACGTTMSSPTKPGLVMMIS
jgi:hypothetical protein